MNDDKEFLYDDEAAVKYIRNFLPQELKTRFSDDDIYYIVDLIYEYYESTGMLEGNDDDTIEIDEDDLIAYVTKQAKKDGFGSFETDEIQHVINGELAYCESINIFD